MTYRLLTKEDFQAASSGSLWGNVAHGAEICTNIVPAADYETRGAFIAVMKPECSFWNKVIAPVGLFGRLLAIASGVPVPVPVKQPDLYILQHEQIHFAIMEVAARQLSKSLAGVPRQRRSDALVERAYTVTVHQVLKRHRELDSDTSGIYDPQSLERWIRVLEVQMRKLCGRGAHCRIRVHRG